MIQKKVCLLGASSVGKTSLVRQFVEGIFDEKYLTTIGVKIDKKIVELTDHQVQFLIWDIEGVDQYAQFQQRYLRGAAAVIIVVDQTRPQSLLDAIDIFTLVKQSISCPFILALNKADLAENLSCIEDKKETFEKQFSFLYRTSAKTGDQVEQMFTELAEFLCKEAG
ncbi:GTP-binding protein [Catenovulum sp. 2E275]|uniref:Rab family GTPase n=1 Tax=Catenovulum sp. 2E275 TaxID=2980497 RepID=UPI0021D138BE|nr:Rab family GTPase [Catenovulum sp. 2E275]MCU4675697.1 GTP-binding protein [Catenovulum sp. 2E275]